MALSYITQLNVKSVAYNLHDSRIGTGDNGGMVLQSSTYLGAESDANKVLAQKDLPIYAFSEATSTATSGMVPSISTAIENAEEVFLRADGVFAVPSIAVGAISKATTTNIGGMKIGFDAQPLYITYRDYAVSLLDVSNPEKNGQAYVRISVFSNSVQTSEGYKAAGLVPGLRVSDSTQWSYYHLTGNKWAQYTVSGTTLILDGV